MTLEIENLARNTEHSEPERQRYQEISRLFEIQIQ